MRKSEKFDESCYDTSNEKCGFAYIFNQYKFKDNNETKREGSLKDVENLQVRLSNWAFDVKTFSDLTLENLKYELTQGKEREKFS